VIATLVDGRRCSPVVQQRAGSRVGVDRGVLAPGGSGMVLRTESPASAQRRLTTNEQISGRAGDLHSRAGNRRGVPRGPAVSPLDPES
jgi:hypothetical protein